QPPKRLDPPKAAKPGWSANPIDAFLLAAMQSRGLKPSPRADRRTLIRRAYLDLLGLPPAPEEVEAFVNDRSPNAWSKLVDRLLPTTASVGRGTGSTWFGMPIPMASNSIATVLTHGDIATT